MVIVGASLLFSSSYISGTLEDGGLGCSGCNLIIISLTNTRKDHIGMYGYHRDTTPNIDSFFKDSLVFENVFSPTPWTLPNGISLFTSLFPYTHGVVNRKELGLVSKNSKTLTEFLKESGYATAAFTGGGDYYRDYGFGVGFDTYYDEVAFSGVSNNVDLAIDWIEENSADKFFLFVQGFDTHCPFVSPAPYNVLYDNGSSDLDTSLCYWNLEKHKTEKNGQYTVYKQGDKESVELILNEQDKQKLVAKYDGSVQYADKSLGKLFSTIENQGLDESTVIIFLSEHGDLLGEHGRFMRTDIQGTFSDDVLNVPLLIKHPRVKEEKKIDGMVNLVDIMPTALSFLNIPYERDTLQGRDIGALVTNNVEVNTYAFAGMVYSGTEDNPFFKYIYDVSMVRSLEDKLIYERISNSKDESTFRDSYEFYNIKSDADELRNLFKGDTSGRVEVLTSVLEGWKDSIR